jgi:hypothetical protein
VLLFVLEGRVAEKRNALRAQCWTNAMPETRPKKNYRNPQEIIACPIHWRHANSFMSEALSTPTRRTSPDERPNGVVQ